MPINSSADIATWDGAKVLQDGAPDGAVAETSVDVLDATDATAVATIDATACDQCNIGDLETSDASVEGDLCGPFSCKSQGPKLVLCVLQAGTPGAHVVAVSRCATPFVPLISTAPSGVFELDVSALSLEKSIHVGPTGAAPNSVVHPEYPWTLKPTYTGGLGGPSTAKLDVQYTQEGGGKYLSAEIDINLKDFP